MLARPGALPARADWSFELKWDGLRAIFSTEDGLRVRSRRGWNMTSPCRGWQAATRQASAAGSR